MKVFRNTLIIMGLLLFGSSESIAQCSGGFICPIGADSTDISIKVMFNFNLDIDFCGSFEDTIIIDDDTLVSEYDQAILLGRIDSSGNKQGGIAIQCNGVAYATSITYDNDSNFYVAGFFTDTIFLGSDSLFSEGKEDIFICKIDSNGNFIWVKREGGPSSDIAVSLKVDSAYCLYLGGTFEDSTTFNTTEDLKYEYNQDIVLAKYDSSGAFKWVKRMGGARTDQLTDMCVDSDNNVYMLGEFWGSAAFDSMNVQSAGSQDIFMCKLDSSGGVIWLKGSGGPGMDLAGGMCVNGDTLYYSGVFLGNAFIDTCYSSFESAGSYDAFISKVDSAGKCLWAKQIGDASYETIKALCVTDSNDVYFTGYFQDSTIVGTDTLTSSGDMDVFAGKCDHNGNITWGEKAGGTDEDIASGIAVYGDKAYIIGSFEGTASFDGTNKTSDGKSDIFIWKTCE